MSKPLAKVMLIIGEKRQLHSVDKSKTLEDNISDICNHFLLVKASYGLKLKEVRKIQINRYLTSRTFQELEDGSSIELVRSIEALVRDLISNGKKDFYVTLAENESDSAFTDEIAIQKKQGEIKNSFFQAQSDTDKATVLLVLVRLIVRHQMPEIETTLLFEVIKIVKSSQTTEKPGIRLIEMSLWMLSQILLKRNSYNNVKPAILRDVFVADIMPYIWWEDHVSIQARTLQLLNAFIRCELPPRPQSVNHKDKQKRVLSDIIVKVNLSNIYNNVIKNDNYKKRSESQVDMGRELGLLQHYILNSLYSGKYMGRTEVGYDQFGCVEGLNTEEILESINAFTLKKYASTDTLKGNDSGFRFSVATIRHSTDTNRIDSFHEESASVRISELTFECLVYYEKMHNENFIKSKIEERMYESGIYKSSERVVKILTKIFRIGTQPNLENCDFHPLVFYTETGHDIFLELFSRTMWLVSKTRREMRAYNQQDYELLFKVVERQMKTVFERRPLDFKQLEMYLYEHNYTDVTTRWVEEQKAEWLTMYNNNSCMNELRMKYAEENKPLIYRKRMNTMKSGENFKIIREKKNKHNSIFHMVLSANEKTVFITNTMNEDNTLPGEFSVDQIRHVIVGNACPHIINNIVEKSKMELVFSLQLEGDDCLNIIADTKLKANYWIDGFNMLIDHPHRSINYQLELDQLVKMDCALHTMELQNIKVPAQPPKLPHPILPKKPVHLEGRTVMAKSQGRDCRVPLQPKRKNSVYKIIKEEQSQQ